MIATYTGIVQSIAVQAWEQTFAGPPHLRLEQERIDFAWLQRELAHCDLIG